MDTLNTRQWIQQQQAEASIRARIMECEDDEDGMLNTLGDVVPTPDWLHHQEEQGRRYQAWKAAKDAWEAEVTAMAIASQPEDIDAILSRHNTLIANVNTRIRPSRRDGARRRLRRELLRDLQHYLNQLKLWAPLQAYNVIKPRVMRTIRYMHF